MFRRAAVIGVQMNTNGKTVRSYNKNWYKRKQKDNKCWRILRVYMYITFNFTILLFCYLMSNTYEVSVSDIQSISFSSVPCTVPASHCVSVTFTSNSCSLSAWYNELVTLPLIGLTRLCHLLSQFSLHPTHVTSLRRIVGVNYITSSPCNASERDNEPVTFNCSPFRVTAAHSE